MFALGSSSSDDLLRKRTNIQRSQVRKQQTSSSSKVAARRTIKEELFEDDDVFESDDEVDSDEESVIDYDDGDDDWEDANEASGQAISDNICFQRSYSRPRLTSYESLLTIQFAASRSTPAFHQSNTSSALGPPVVSSPDLENNILPVMKRKAGSKAYRQIDCQPEQALPTRPARRNVLATKLSISLRRHLQWERQQKYRTSNTVLERRHTARDVASLKQYPAKVCMKEENNDALKTYWNEFFITGFSEYNSKGW